MAQAWKRGKENIFRNSAAIKYWHTLYLLHPDKKFKNICKDADDNVKLMTYLTIKADPAPYWSCSMWLVFYAIIWWTIWWRGGRCGESEHTTLFNHHRVPPLQSRHHERDGEIDSHSNLWHGNSILLPNWNQIPQIHRVSLNMRPSIQNIERHFWVNEMWIKYINCDLSRLSHYSLALRHGILCFQSIAFPGKVKI